MMAHKETGKFLAGQYICLIMKWALQRVINILRPFYNLVPRGILPPRLKIGEKDPGIGWSHDTQNLWVFWCLLTNNNVK